MKRRERAVSAIRENLSSRVRLIAAAALLFGFPTVAQQPTAAPAPGGATAATVDPDISQKLLKAKRIYVESFGDDPLSRQFHAMVIDSLNQTHRFIITENKEKADAVLRGSGLEKTAQELHAISEGTSVAGAGGSSSSSIKGTAGNIQGSSSSAFGALDVATADAQATTLTVNDARVAVRLVAADGDVLWSTTQESKGAKYKGASADVADKIAKQLLRDIEKLLPQANNKPAEKK